MTTNLTRRVCAGNSAPFENRTQCAKSVVDRQPATEMRQLAAMLP